MSFNRFKFILAIFILCLILVFPGVAFAEDNSIQSIDPSSTLVIQAPEQTETDQTLTLIALVRENEYNEPVSNARVNFFIKSDFFIKDLVEIGEAVTNEHGLAVIEYIPNEPGVLNIVASYQADSNFEPIIVERMVNVIGEDKSFYKSKIGIEFPRSFYLWMITIVVIMSAVWGTFIFVLYQVVGISRKTGARGASIVLVSVVALLFVLITMVLITPESQFNFGLLP